MALRSGEQGEPRRSAFKARRSFGRWPQDQNFVSQNFGAVAQLGERVLCKHEVRGSIPLSSTRLPRIRSKLNSFRVLDTRFYAL